MSGYHVPVLGEATAELLLSHGAGLFLDGTVGGGGHSLMLLERSPECRVLAVDRDPEALDEARRTLEAHRDRVRFLQTRFDRATDDIEVRDRGLDGALLDLGVSSRQLDADRRGFTFRRGAPLDMRMGTEGPTAAEVLAKASEDQLARIFREYGEERHARRLARAIVARRAETPIETSDDLVGIIDRSLPGRVGMQDRARIFQALRIEVNGEIDALEAALPAIRDALNEDGVLVVIAYHSLEDRIVKNAFRDWSKACVCPPELPVCVCRGAPLGETLTRKPIRPTEAEIEANPRARSARLRAWRKAA